MKILLKHTFTPFINEVHLKKYFSSVKSKKYSSGHLKGVIFKKLIKIF